MNERRPRTSTNEIKSDTNRRLIRGRFTRLTLGAATLALFAAAEETARADVTRPLNVVTFGDSIMWGQGLSEAHKFRNIVAAHIRTLTTRQVTLTNFARSGARIATGPTTSSGTSATLPRNDGVQPLPFFDSSVAGEIPWSLPSVTAQSATAAVYVNKDNVDLILMNGGGNDVGLSPAPGATSILSTDPTLGVTWATNWTQTHAVDRMTTLLTNTLTMYPNAIVVVVGYYPPVSSDSDTGLLGSWKGAGAFVGNILSAIAAKTVWTDRSTAFYDTMNAGYAAAVAAANRTPSNNNRAVFAKLDWDPSWSYGASNTLLWKIAEADDVKPARIPVCNADALGFVDNAVCETASVGHPNVAGAAYFANVIEAALEPKMCALLSLKPMRTSMTVTGDPAGTPTVKVTAVDAATQQPIAGAVHITGLPGTRPALGPGGPTNTSFTSRLLGIGGPIGKPALERDVRATVSVTAPGYCTAFVNIPAATTPPAHPPAAPRVMDVSGVPARGTTASVGFTVVVKDHITHQPVSATVKLRNLTLAANQLVHAALCTTASICGPIVVSEPGYTTETIDVFPVHPSPGAM